MVRLRVTVVVVDDDDGHVELVRRNLRRAGIENNIVSFGNGRDALDFVFARGPHAGRTGNGELLILLDINMPMVSGIEVLRQIKSSPQTKSIPVIMLTTSDDPREVNRCYELGCNLYVVKPVESEAFLDAVRRLGMFLSIVCVPSDAERWP